MVAKLGMLRAVTHDGVGEQRLAWGEEFVARRAMGAHMGGDPAF